MGLGVSSSDDRDEALEGDTGGNISCCVEGRGTSRSDSVDLRLILVELGRGAPVYSDYPRHECGQHASCLSSHFPIVHCTTLVLDVLAPYQESSGICLFYL